MSTYRLLLQCPYSLGRHLASLRGTYRHTLSFLQTPTPGSDDLRPTLLSPGSKVDVEGTGADYSGEATIGDFHIPMEMVEDDSRDLAERVVSGYADLLVRMCRNYGFVPLLYDYGVVPRTGNDPKYVGLIPVRKMRDDTMTPFHSMSDMATQGPQVTLMGRAVSLPMATRTSEYNRNKLSFGSAGISGKFLQIPEGAIIGRSLGVLSTHLSGKRRDGRYDFYWPRRYITDIRISMDRDIQYRRHVMAMEIRHSELPGAFAPVQLEMYVSRDYLSQLLTCLNPDTPLRAGPSGMMMGTLSNAYVDGFADVILIETEETHRDDILDTEPVRLERVIPKNRNKRRLRVKKKLQSIANVEKK